jgi:imidazolonepropionase-like amidohydrolase
MLSTGSGFAGVGVHRIRQMIEALRADPDAPTVYASVTIAEDPAWAARATAFALEDGDEAGAASLRARLPVHDVTSARAAVDRFVDLGADFVKIRSFASPETFAAFAEAAHARGLRVGGHAPTSFAPSVAVRAGLDSVEHGLIALVFVEEAEREAELEALVTAFRDTGAALCPRTIATACLLLDVDDLRARIAAIDDVQAVALTGDVLRAWAVAAPRT